MAHNSARPGIRSLTPLVLVLLCCLAPVVAAVVVYLNPQWWPGSGSYGRLVQPQRPVPQALALRTLQGEPFDLRSLQGKWLLVVVDQSACPESCARKLFISRNTHASQGKNVDRLKRVWLITDDGPVPDKVLEAYRGTLMLRAQPEALQSFLMPDQAGNPAALRGPIWVVDPLGNLMLQFPAQADGVEVRQDISRLLYNSRIG